MRSRFGSLGLVLASIVLTLAGLEIGLRLTRVLDEGIDGLTHWPNLVLEARTAKLDAETAGRAVHDARLGFVGRPGYRSHNGRLGYDAEGYRVAPAPPGVPLEEPPILVVGDSFAHGDGLSDGESWPARLQSLTGRRVVNAAMSGYGLDQIALRAGFAAPEVKPAALVLSFIADDLRRAEMKRVWGMEKPWFALTGGTLALNNVPVPPHPDPASTLDLWQRLFGWSVLLDTVLDALGWRYEWALDYERALPRGAGERLACPLMKRVAALGLPTLVVAEYDAYHWQDEAWRAVTRRIDDTVLDCARAAGLSTLDLFETMDEGVRRQGLAALFTGGHPSAAGAALAARRIAQEVRTLLK